MNNIHFNIKNLFQDIKNFYPLIIIFIFFFFVCLITGMGLCPVRATLGIPCPGCGLSRALLLIVQGNLIEAWCFHPFSYVFIIFITMFFINRYLYQYTSDITLKKGLFIIACFMLIFYLYRMIRFFPNQSPMIFYDDSILSWFKKHLSTEICTQFICLIDIHFFKSFF